MYKKLGIIASVLTLSAMALFWSGCSDSKYCCEEQPTYAQPGPSAQPVSSAPAFDSYPESSSYQACPPACPQPCAPACPPACPPICKPACPPACPPVCKPMCPPPACPPPACKPCPPPCPQVPACLEEPPCKIPAKCKHPSSNELTCLDGITVTARNPSMCMLGEQYPLEFTVHACQDVCDATVTTHLPDGVTFVKSTPEAKVEGKKLTWNIGSMSKGDCILAKVFVKCECEGELCACFCATATPVRFCSLLCAKPVLTCQKTGDCEVCPGDPIHYSIVVSNRGSCAAQDVIITDNLPKGVEHSSCQRTLIFKLGCLEPCECKKVEFCVTAVERGKVCNTAVVTACNADSTSCQWCTNVCKECVELVKVGPKEQAIGKNADYQITVTNPGDKSLTEVVVTDMAPSATSIVAANGAKINGNQAVWKLKELKPGEKANFNLTLTTCTPGCFTNRVHVTNCQGCEACAEATTRWKGRPALNVTICDTEDPICIGDTTSYRITVVNQGSEADNNVVVTVRFPEEISPLAASGATSGTVSGQTVTFAPYNNFGARQTLEYRVDARAKKSGDARINVEVTSDSIRTPIMQQESTIVN